MIRNGSCSNWCWEDDTGKHNDANCVGGSDGGGSGGGELGVGFGFRMCFTVLDPTIGLYTTFDGKGFVECVRQT